MQSNAVPLSTACNRQNRQIGSVDGSLGYPYDDCCQAALLRGRTENHTVLTSSDSRFFIIFIPVFPWLDPSVREFSLDERREDRVDSNVLRTVFYSHVVPARAIPDHIHLIMRSGRALLPAPALSLSFFLCVPLSAFCCCEDGFQCDEFPATVERWFRLRTTYCSPRPCWVHTTLPASTPFRWRSS